LLGRHLASVARVDLLEVVTALRGRPLFGLGLRNADKLQHPLGHAAPKGSVILLLKKRAGGANAAPAEAFHHLPPLKSIKLT